jgi:protein SCO1/2
MIRLIAIVASILLCRPALAFDPFQMTGIDRKEGAPIPIDLPYRDENGAVTTIRALADGKPVLLVPVLHDCPNICGVTFRGLARAVSAQSLALGRDFSIVAFGIDPAEGPAEAASSLSALRHDFPKLAVHGLHALAGTSGNIAAVTKALGYRYAWDAQIGQYAHIAATAVLTADGRLSRWLYGLAPDPTDLDLALTEAGGGRIGSWADQLLLLCYHYDPETGRYAATIRTLLRVGGGATATLGAALIGLALFRERRKAKRRE